MLGSGGVRREGGGTRVGKADLGGIDGLRGVDWEILVVLLAGCPLGCCCCCCCCWVGAGIDAVVSCPSQQAAPPQRCSSHSNKQTQLQHPEGAVGKGRGGEGGQGSRGAASP